ncbi:MAG: right-handed parallel beta-helix repeat-containing protein [Planctomycetota bacterium]
MSATASRIELFVSPEGDDAWSGRLDAPDAGRTDGPLRTPAAAQARVRRLLAERSEPGEVYVTLRGGRYELDAPLCFTALDSGARRVEDRRLRTWPVVWRARAGEAPILSGGRRLEGAWRDETVNGVAARVLDLPEVAAGRWAFRQLWIDGARRARPRLPREGFHQVERALDADYTRHGHSGGSTRFGFAEGAVDATWRNLRDVEVQFFGWWIAPRVRLAEVDAATRTATLDRNSRVRLAWSEGDGVDYRVENVFEALTEPGEWYLDRSTGRLVCIPLPGEDLDAAEVIAPRLQHLVRIDGAALLRFEGIVFAHNEWRCPDGYADSMQASFEVPGAVVLHRADTCVFERCRIEHTNTYGVELERDSVDCALEACTLQDLGAGGVKIWHGCRRNAVRDCTITAGGRVYPAGVGVLVGRATGNRIEHNHIHDFYYSGISAGWSWGYGESDGYGNLIEWNHIHDIGQGVLSDMGGVYLLGHAAGTRVCYNHIHDISCRRYGGWCIYTDEGSSDVLVESNLCHNANRNAYNQHYGRNNLVRNNIFAHGGDAVISYGRPEAHLGLVFESNILLARDTPILRNLTAGRWTTEQTVFRRNLYWCETGPVAFACGGASIHATQPFPDGFAAEAERFAPLADLPAVDGPPAGADWAVARTVETFVSQTGVDRAAPGTGVLRLLRQGGTLHLRADLARPPRFETVEGALWNREHLELFLAPAGHPEALAQFGVASDGETALLLHGQDAPPALDWSGTAAETEAGWRAELSLPLDALAAAFGLAPESAWTFLAGFATPPECGDWAMWRRHGHDPEGVVADPGFVDASGGDFHLRPDAPALALGFVPFDFDACGPRDPAGRRTPGTRD